MAYSMMSSTNYKRKFELLPKNHEGDDCCSTDENSIDDWINVDLEDFLANGYDDNNENEDSFFISSSKNSSDLSDDAAYAGFSLHKNNRENLMSKKRKTMENFVDHDLEDTASSPAQSPKVNDFNLFYMKSKETENRDIYQENGNTSPQGEDSTNMSLIESELKKKGLCLIPTSMLLNYLSANII